MEASCPAPRALLPVQCPDPIRGGDNVLVRRAGGVLPASLAWCWPAEVVLPARSCARLHVQRPAVSMCPWASRAACALCCLWCPPRSPLSPPAPPPAPGDVRRAGPQPRAPPLQHPRKGGAGRRGAGRDGRRAGRGSHSPAVEPQAGLPAARGAAPTAATTPSSLLLHRYPLSSPLPHRSPLPSLLPPPSCSWRPSSTTR